MGQPPNQPVDELLETAKRYKAKDKKPSIRSEGWVCHLVDGSIIGRSNTDGIYFFMPDIFFHDTTLHLKQFGWLAKKMAKGEEITPLVCQEILAKMKELHAKSTESKKIKELMMEKIKALESHMTLKKIPLVVEREVAITT